MKINRKNYESYFLDYFENSLLPEQVAELMVFLEENPDLKEEFESFDSIALSPDDSITFNKKKLLAKSEYKPTAHIDAWNYEEKMVAHLEGDLTDTQTTELKEFLEINPNARLELNLFKKTRLMPALIQYPEKKALKKKGMFVLYSTQIRYAVISAAAIILLLFGLFSILNRQNTIAPAPNNLVGIQAQEVPSVGTDEKTIDMQSRNDYAAREISLPEEESIQPKRNSVNPMHMASVSIKAPVEIAGTKESSPASILLSTTFKGVILAGNYGEVEKQRSFAARFIAGLSRKLIGDPVPDNKSFLEITIDGYNMMADREVEVDKEYDATGKVIAYSVNGQNVALFRGRETKE